MPPHCTEIRDDVQQLILQRRGDRPIQPELTAKDTALIVIDMQTAFVDTRLPSGVPMAHSIVANINRLAASMRDHGGEVVWVYSTFDDTIKTAWNAFFGNIYPEALSDAVIDNLRAGSGGHKLFDELDIDSGDRQFSKDRFSAFFPGACALPAWLQQRGIRTVAIAGTLTNVCCESSARDAMMQNFNVVMISDANAARTDADHNASMTGLIQTFADVLDTSTFLSTLTASERTSISDASNANANVNATANAAARTAANARTQQT